MNFNFDAVFSGQSILCLEAIWWHNNWNILPNEKSMKNNKIQAAMAVAVAGLVIYLVRKKILVNNKRKIREKNDKEFASRQRRRFSDAYGEYTL
jgi:hypothetical protein